MFPTSMSQVELIKSSKIWCQLKQEKIKKKERKKMIWLQDNLHAYILPYDSQL